jgi:hypothetical protein
MAVLSEACVYFEERDRIRSIEGYLPEMHEKQKATYDTIEKVGFDGKGILRRLASEGIPTLSRSSIAVTIFMLF